ncbi:MAG: beta-ketoacyl-[acyl-carrier-protein] synthase II, partial [Anaerolineae bacterium]|nr:beta-ketoacyl-[acyl-carrier-protein] synthase II [Anaerolineae bacterium]
MKKRVVITGLGCISPVGNDVPTTWSNIAAGKTGAARITHYDPSDHKCQIAAEVKGFDANDYFGVKEARRMDRFSQFAMVATDQALIDSGLVITDDNK